MKLFQLTYCCCGCSLTTGSLIIGFIESAFSLFFLIGFTLLSVEVSTWTNADNYKDAVVAICIFLAVESGIQLITAICLLTGTFMSKHDWFVPWLVYAGIDALLVVILGILNSVLYFDTITALYAVILISVSIVYFLMKIYFFLVVFSLFRVLKTQVKGAEAFSGPMKAEPY